MLVAVALAAAVVVVAVGNRGSIKWRWWRGHLMVVYLMAFKGGSDGLWWWCRKTSWQLEDAKAAIKLRQQWQLVVGIVAMGGTV
jgi:hypothetical protein